MILVLKTADRTTQIQLLSPEGAIIKSMDWASDRQLSDQFHGKILETLHQADNDLQDLTGIIIFSGPGSFTSLRIGHAVANALAASLHIPVAGATDPHWTKTALAALSSTPPGHPALPHYGAEANITRPQT